MRATEYLNFVVIIGLIAIFITLGAYDFNHAYENQGKNINVSEFTGDYDNVDSINDKVNNSLNNFKKLGDEESSWFSRIGAGIIAIPYAIISLPLLIIDGLSLIITMITNTLGLYLPSGVIFVLVGLLMIDILRRFMEFFGKGKV